MKFLASALVALSSVSFASAECCVPETYLTKLDFFGSVLTNNKLHNGGNTTYSGVGEFENKRIDLVVTADDSYKDIKKVWKSRDKLDPGQWTLNGLRGAFGTINLQTVKNKPDSGKGTFKFCLYDEREELVTLPSHSFSIYDADIRGTGKAIEEKLVVDFESSENAGIDSFQLGDAPNTEITVTCEGSGNKNDLGFCNGGATVFNAGNPGVGEDNPSDPNDLTPLQMRRSILFYFKETSCWTFTYNHYCPYEQEGYTPQGKCKGYTGGNFLFSGHSDEISRTEECTPVHPTEDPTEAPTEYPEPVPPLTDSPTYKPTEDPTYKPTEDPTYKPTESPTYKPTEDPTYKPTADPTYKPTEDPTYKPTESPTYKPTEDPTYKPTESPTYKPTDPPVDPPTPECPADIELVKHIGVTEIDIGGSIEIVSRDGDTVSVKLTNTWGEDLDIYYQYKPDVFNEKCYKADDVPTDPENPESTYANITLQCYHMKAFTELEICVTDDCTIWLSEDDNAEVPQCCPDQEADVSQVVCYNLIVWCEDQCLPTARNRALRALRGHA